MGGAAHSDWLHGRALRERGRAAGAPKHAPKQNPATPSCSSNALLLCKLFLALAAWLGRLVLWSNGAVFLRYRRVKRRRPRRCACSRLPPREGVCKPSWFEATSGAVL
jgi:hypothetical protein